MVPPADGVPYAYLDFSVDREGEVYHRDHAAALGEIGRQLGVECPRFEVARSVLLWKQGVREMPGTTAGQAASTGWQIAVSLGQDLAGALIPGVNVAGKVLEKLGEAAGPRLRATALGRWLESRGGSQALRELAARTAKTSPCRSSRGFSRRMGAPGGSEWVDRPRCARATGCRFPAPDVGLSRTGPQRLPKPCGSPVRPHAVNRCDAPRTAEP